MHKPSLPVLPPPLPAPRAYLARVLESSAVCSSLSGIAMVRIETNGKKFVTKNLFFLQGPDLLRIETLGFLSRPVLLLTCNGSALQLYDIAAKKCYRGEPTLENISSLFGVALSPAAMNRALRGLSPFTLDPDSRVSCTSRANRYIFSVSDTTDRYLLWITPDTGKTEKLIYFVRDNQILEISWSDFTAIAGQTIPTRVAIETSSPHPARMLIQMKSLSVRTLAPDLFTLSPALREPCSPLEQLFSSP